MSNEPYPFYYHHTAHTFPSLAENTNEELKGLTEDIDKMDEFIAELPQVKQMNEDIETHLQTNIKLAKMNLEKQPLIEFSKEQLLGKLEHMSSLREKYDEISSRYTSLSEKYTPTCIQENLKSAGESADAESEPIAEQFLQGDMDVDTFLSVYIEKRTLNHSRQVKAENLHQQLLQLQKAGF